MPAKTPRKKEAEIPKLDGWTFFPFTTNLYLKCQKCGELPGEMFYRSVKRDGESYSRTEAVCVPCASIAPGERKQG